ncbi:ParM/StbA family protein [Lutispora thermophila]|mgnify:CR=1 FL=1|uniref:Plasmid segregation protein ParM n=1 Tax=Lutispora thermophila DSM 19022 TaxID=1122184 RepID=A0A1M6G1V8_9FIRM|nr:ParM/StbA family protein [Lutispora thermophila]SHJ03857.1 plasmid segregation protein ParM [Lutispora thermophila DSM 19022]
MIIGVDQGYSHTKTSEGSIFPSKISTESYMIGESTEVKIDGKSYLVGEGNIEVELNKVNKELTRVCILTALAQSGEHQEYQVVTGLPIGLYKTQRGQLKEMLLSNRRVELEYNRQKRILSITKAEVFPQAAGVFYMIDRREYEDYNTVVITDIGGRSVDFALFEQINKKWKLTRYSTIMEGTLTLYSKIINLINSRYELALKVEDGETILRKGLQIYGEKQDLSFIKAIIADHIEAIYRELYLKYPIKTSKHIIAGGGAYLFKDIIERKIPRTVLVPNAQFANAIGFKKVGEALWQRY